MLISTKGRYALCILVDMAEHQTDGYLPLKEIAERQEISEKYLESIIKTLVKSSVVVAMRGKGGGYRLNRPPEEINVGDVLEIAEDSLSPVSCLETDRFPCPRMARCRTLDFWRGLDATIRAYIHRFTVADFTKPNQSGDDYVI